MYRRVLDLIPSLQVVIWELKPWSCLDIIFASLLTELLVRQKHKLTCLVNIIQCCLTFGMSDSPTILTWIALFKLRIPQWKNMIYSILEFYIRNICWAQFIDINICCGFQKKCVNKLQLICLNWLILHSIICLSPLLTCIC